MTHYFFDSSAIIKRYILEQGTTWVRSITPQIAGNTIIVAHVTRVEIMSGISRRVRDNQISAHTSQSIRLLVDRHTKREYRVVQLIDQILQQAEDLLEKHPLRAYDAIQLASAQTSNDRLISSNLAPLVFVSADTRLVTIAIAEGFNVENPNNYP